MSDRRPYIPLAVRIKVAFRQLDAFYNAEKAMQDVRNHPLKEQLRYLLKFLFADENYQLDHDPALELRVKYRRHGKLFYSPPANSPDHLIYRRKGAHAQKTYGRKEGAERTVTTKGSDVWLIAKNRKKKPRRKQKIPSRPFPAKSRPFGRGRTLTNNNNFGRRR